MNTADFNEVLSTHQDMAYRMACRLTRGNESLAHDLVQDAFLRVWKHWGSKRPDSFKGWLYRILHNLYMDHLRRRSREVSETLIETKPERGPLPLEQLEQKELKRVVHRALDQLPQDFRVPVMLCDMEGYSYEEIAQIVSCPVGTVRSRIHRGRRDLRAALVQLAPILVAAATAIGAWLLSRAQRQFSSKVHIEMVGKPLPPTTIHAKGESRENTKS